VLHQTPTIQLARKNSFFLLFFCIHLWDGFALGEQRERGGVSVIKIISYTRCVRLMKRGRQQTAHINQLRHCFLLLPSGFSACFGRGWGYVRCMYGMECRNLGSNAKLFSFRLARVIGDLGCFWFNVGCDAFVAAGTCGVHVLLSTVHIYIYLLSQPTEWTADCYLGLELGFESHPQNLNENCITRSMHRFWCEDV
jgi:hypothetical protein